MANHIVSQTPENVNGTIHEPVQIGDDLWLPYDIPGRQCPYILLNMRTLRRIVFATETSRGHTIEMGQRLLGVAAKRCSRDSAELLEAALKLTLTFNTPGGK